MATPSSISEDGGTIVGTHNILGSLDTSHGFIWTAEGGTVEIDAGNRYDFIAPIGMTVQVDGSTTFVGIAPDQAAFSAVGLAVTIPSPVPSPAAVALLPGSLGIVGGMTRRRGCATQPFDRCGNPCRIDPHRGMLSAARRTDLRAPQLKHTEA